MTDPPAMREKLLGKINLFLEVCEVNHRHVITLETTEVRELLRQAALPSDAEIDAIARRKVDEILSPDPNHPEDDTYHLQFPHAVEEVEGRDFWRKHLTELFEVFLREELRGGTQ